MIKIQCHVYRRDEKIGNNEYNKIADNNYKIIHEFFDKWKIVINDDEMMFQAMLDHLYNIRYQTFQ